MGAASATKTQKRSMAAPNVALFDRKIKILDLIGDHLAFESNATFHQGQPSRVDRREALETNVLSYCALPSFLSNNRLFKPNARIQQETTYVRYHLSCHCHKGQYHR